MRDLFPGYYKKTDQEIQKFWEETTFIFDTNIFLNFYQFDADDTRQRWFTILECLKDRCWIPHHVALEFNKRRLGVIQDQIDAYTKLATTFEKMRQELENFDTRHMHIDVKRLIEKPYKSLGEAKDTITKDATKKKLMALKENDIYRKRIDSILSGKIGKPYSEQQLFSLYQRIENRYKFQIPPGWRDKGKQHGEGTDRYGDAIIWFQILDFATLSQKNIIFVTGDTKPDWFQTSAKLAPN